MSKAIVTFRTNDDVVKAAAVSAMRAMKSGEPWMYEFRWYRVRSLDFEDGALVIRGDLLHDHRASPMLAGATFSDSAA